MDDKQIKVITLASNSVILSILLAMVGGFLDAYTFISRDGVFANAQTGNIVLFAVKAANKDWSNALLHIPPIAAFIAGVIVSEVAKNPSIREVLYSYRRSILILETIILLIIGFLPETIPNLVVTVSISFVSSLQISTFTKVEKWGYNSTMTTGNLRTATQAAYAAFVARNQDAKKQFMDFSGIILSFLFGALVGTFSTTYIGNTSIWIPSIILIISLLLYHRDRGYFRKSITARKA